MAVAFGQLGQTMALPVTGTGETKGLAAGFGRQLVTGKREERLGTPLREENGSTASPNRRLTYLRWTVQLPVHSFPTSIVLRKTSLSSKSPPLQVNILVWVLLLCWDDVNIHCRLNMCRQ